MSSLNDIDVLADYFQIQSLWQLLKQSFGKSVLLNRPHGSFWFLPRQTNLIEQQFNSQC